MLSYVTIGAVDLNRSKAFYDAVLGTLGWKEYASYGDFRGYSPAGDPKASQNVWVCKPHDGKEACVGNGMMVAFKADGPEQVHAFYDAAMANGGSDEGPPGPRGDYGPNWYAAYLRDPTGNKLAIVHNG